MLKLIVGVKGTGKTKTLINLANTALDSVSGCVVVIEKGSKLTHEIKNKARLVNTEEYGINDAHMLYGFVSGTYASNYDVANIFIFSSLKICGDDMAEFIKFVDADDYLKLDILETMYTIANPAKAWFKGINGMVRYE